MANWKKIITSGSNAELNDISSSGDMVKVLAGGTVNAYVLSSQTGSMTTEWDGTHDGNGEISGSFVVSGSTFTVNAVGGVDIDATGAISLDSSAGSIDMNVVDEQTVSIGLNGASETIWTPSNTAGTEKWSTIVTSGDTDGTDAAGSILLSSAAGGIGLAWHDAKDLWAEGGKFIVTANEDGAGAIKLHADAGVSQTILIQNDAGTTDGTDAAGSVLVAADAGGIGLAWADTKDLWAEGGKFIVTANEDGAGAIKLHADAGVSQTILIQNDAGTTDGTDGAGSVLVAADAGGIGLAWADTKDLWAEGGKFIVTANEDGAGAIKLHADAGVSQTISILNDEGTNNAAIGLVATAGGITLTSATAKEIKVGTVSGAPISIGHTTSETTVNDNLTVTGDLTINGTTTTINTQQLSVSESMIFLASGSHNANVDGGILVQSGSTANSGSAMYHDISSHRWAVGKQIGILNPSAPSSANKNGFVVTVKSLNLAGAAPYLSQDGSVISASSDGTEASASYGVGEIIIDNNTSNDGDIWILSAV